MRRRRPRIYREGQAAAIFDFINTEPDSLIVAGPADGNEAQVLVKKYPSIKRVVGCEPSALMRERTRALFFPGILLPFAVWSDDCEVKLAGCETNKQACLANNVGGEVQTVPARSLDSLDREYGPFRNAILWLVIQGGGPAALRGAETMFQERRVACCVVMSYFKGIEKNDAEISEFFRRQCYPFRANIRRDNNFQYQAHTRTE